MADELLPQRIEILFDQSATGESIRVFLECVAAQLVRETSIWRQRTDQVVEQKLIARSELDAAFKRLRSAQTWYIYESAPGGLTAGAPLETAGDPDREKAGVIPCSAATHHGVAWWPSAAGRGVGLVTSRKIDGHWNWDEDIGHEAAHASFGPVPLYSQSLESDGFKTRLADAYAAAGGAFNDVLVARTTYLISEIMVAFVRGEQRATGSGLPGLHSRDDFQAFCTMAQALFPYAGFDTCLSMAETEGMPLAVWSGPTIRTLGAAALRAARAIVPLVNATRPPAPRDLAAA